MARIGIDATHILPQGKGVSRYEKNLIRSLIDAESRHEFFIFHRASVKEAMPEERPNGHFVGVPFWTSVFWEQCTFPWLLRKYKLDLAFTVSERLPLLGKTPAVLQLFEIPTYRVQTAGKKAIREQWYHGLSEAYMMGIFPFALKKAVLIIVSSEFTKRDLVEKFNVPEQKIKVIYAGCEDNFKPARNPERISEIRKFASGGCPYLLHFSSGDPRDNTEFLLDVFWQVKTAVPFELKLIIVGAGKEQMAHLCSKYQLNGSVVWRPYVSDQEIIELYQGASVYVDPSWYEGFGFQPLEAMATGIPVVASNRTAIPEIVGEAGVLVDPASTRAFVESITGLLTNPALLESFKEAGLARAARFKWPETALRILESFETALRESESCSELSQRA